MVIPAGVTVLSIQVNDACDLACGYCPDELHRGGRAMSREMFLSALAEAERGGCRRIALGGGEPTLWPELGWAVRVARTRGFEVALLFWAAGWLTRLGVRVALDSYAYRRAGFAEGCGEGLARIGVDGSVRPCSFSHCEFYDARLNTFALEQAADRAARPMREVVLVENSEIGFYVPLSDSLEVSLGQLAWEDIFGALEELQRIAATLGPWETRIANTFTPQADDTAGGPVPPILATLDDNAGEVAIQRILDAATSPPLAGRRVGRSNLLREVEPADTIPSHENPQTRQGYVGDLAWHLEWMVFQLDLPIVDALRETVRRIADASQEFSFASTTFGQGCAAALRRHLRPSIHRAAEALRRRARGEANPLTWHVDTPNVLGWLALAAALDLDASGSVRAHLERLPTLAERLGHAIGLFGYAPHCAWLRAALAELMHDARRRYTRDGRAAVRLAVGRQRQDAMQRSGPLPSNGRAERSIDVAGALPEALVRFRATLAERCLRHAGPLQSTAWLPPLGPRAFDVERAVGRAVDSALRRLAQDDADLAAAASWEGDWPPIEPSLEPYGQPNRRIVGEYVIEAYDPRHAPDPRVLGQWAGVAAYMGWGSEERRRRWHEAATNHPDKVAEAEYAAYRLSHGGRRDDVEGWARRLMDLPNPRVRAVVEPALTAYEERRAAWERYIDRGNE